MKDKNELIELFGQMFGKIVADEIQKYDKDRQDDSKYSEDVKNIKTIVENAVDEICRYIGPDTALILERLDAIIEKLGIIAANTSPYSIKPWTTGPQIYPNTPDPLNPLGPVITYGFNDDRVTLTTTAATGDQNFPATHTTYSSFPEDLEDVIYSMFG